MIKLKQKNNRKIWFMSDLHIGHKNILNLSNRPFQDIDEMKKYIMKELKDKVSTGDIVFELGDLMWKSNASISDEIYYNTDGAAYYKILGNHDDPKFYYNLLDADTGTMISVENYNEISYTREDGTNYMLMLSHYPMLSWHHKFRGSFMIHGHCHGNIDILNESSPDLRVDVGFDGSLAKKVGSFLIEIEDIIKYFKEKVGTDNFVEYAKNNYNIL